MGDHAVKTALFSQFGRVAKALGHPARMELVDLLAQGERTVESLASAAQLALSTASAHLQTLKRAHLVTTRRDGTRSYYALSGRDVAELYVRLHRLAQAHLPEVEPARRAYLGLDATTNTEIEELDRDELARRLAAGSAMVLDVRPPEEYAGGHIPGAHSIPLEELHQRLAELPTDRTVVAYCRGTYCVFAHEAVRTLRARGYPALRLAEGMLEWRLAGLPVTTAP